MLWTFRNFFLQCYFASITSCECFLYVNVFLSITENSSWPRLGIETAITYSYMHYSKSYTQVASSFLQKYRISSMQTGVPQYSALFFNLVVYGKNLIITFSLTLGAMLIIDLSTRYSSVTNQHGCYYSACHPAIKTLW